MKPIRLQTPAGVAGSVWSAAAGMTRILVETQRGGIGADVQELPAGGYRSLHTGLTFPTLGGALWFEAQRQRGAVS